MTATIRERCALWLEDGTVYMIDQRLLPHELKILALPTYQDTVEAIRDMATRGAGSIGVAAGFAVAQAARSIPQEHFWDAMQQAADTIRSARPTAQNLFYAVDRVLAAMHAPDTHDGRTAAATTTAQAIYDDDVRMSAAIGRAGIPLIPTGQSILTHCNAGWLAIAGWGSALAPIHLAHQDGHNMHVYATETRPRSQGAKLTAWELHQAGVPHTLIADTAVGYHMRLGKIGLVIVGADRIAANGDTANKIGTYQLATLARAHDIPCYIAAPSSTFDANCATGDAIPIEERSEEEVLLVSGTAGRADHAAVRIAPEGVHADNPAFDVTPAALLSGFVTEHGIIAPTTSAIARFLAQAR